MRLLLSRSVFGSRMMHVPATQDNEAREAGTDVRRRLEQFSAEAVRGCAEARRAIVDGGIMGLCDRAQISVADITRAILGRYTEDAIIKLSTASLRQLDDKGPVEFISAELRRSGLKSQMGRRLTFRRPTGNR